MGLFSKKNLLLLALAAGSGCAPSRGDVCAPGNDIRISVGNATYVVRNEDLVFTSPEAPPGLINHSGKNSDGIFIRYCQKKGQKSVNVNSFGLKIEGKRTEASRNIREILIQIFDSNHLNSSAKPPWPYINSNNIRKIYYGEIVGRPKNEVVVPVGFTLNRGRDKSLSVKCGWTDLPFGRLKRGGWIATCRPILPLAHGNFLEISTGGTPDDRLDAIGDDILHALASVESFTAKGTSR
ncbi:hypothetical protein [Sphingomonas panacis]|uniref:hypothetical protein n=1 Tax=Sphingomonas panacis TaxID=1560345 RepID=UPI0012377A31|nr:hypothetical protein [Sphingomonas panacis]